MLSPESPSADPVFLGILACFIGGDYDQPRKVRGTYGVRKLFDRCGLSVEDYRGNAKADWVRESLARLSGEQMQNLLAQLLSSQENGDAFSARLAQDELNAMLAPKGYSVTTQGRAKPAVEQFNPGDLEATSGVGKHGLIDPDFEQLDITQDEANRLDIAWHEAIFCYKANAYLASMIMLGSLLEAILLLALQKNRQAVTDAGIRLLDNKHQVKPIEKWTLSEMIDVISRLGWTTQKITAFAHSLREYRNLVHPELRKRLTDLPKNHECRIASIVIARAVEDLRAVIKT